MKAKEYHRPLQPLVEACRLAETDWICLPNPLVGFGAERGVLWRACVLLRHVALAIRCWAACFHSHILVREFSTLPLLAVFPFLWPLRRKLFFVINHNLQWAVRSRTERFGLTALARLDARWAIFETQGLSSTTAFNIPSEHNLVLLHPVPEKTAGEKNNACAVIGVAGYFRPEKGIEELLALLTEHFPDCDIVIGAADSQRVCDLPDKIRVVNTATDEAYRRMLAQCDVLVQNGAKDSYFYRVSGPVADAAACGTAVVVPDFPLLRHQITSPVQVGEVFQGLDEIPDVVRAAIKSVRSGKYNFNVYCEARSAQALASQLDEFSRRQDG